MSLFKKISEYFSTTSMVDEAGYWVYVRCNKCQEPLKSRVNLHHDLSVDYDGPKGLSLIHISEPTRRRDSSRMPSSA